MEALTHRLMQPGNELELLKALMKIENDQRPVMEAIDRYEAFLKKHNQLASDFAQSLMELKRVEADTLRILLDDVLERGWPL